MSELTVIKEKKNELMNRKEIIVNYENVGKSTPKHAEVLKIMSEFVKKGPAVISVKKIDQKFGGGKCVVEALIYDTKELKEKYETLHKKKKVKKEEAPKEEKKAK